MVFNNTAVILLIAVITVWNTILTFIVIRSVRHYNRLTGESGGDTLSKVLHHLLSSLNTQARAQEKLEKQLINLEKAAKLHIQRVGIVRYNPFSDTGGSQSFTFALLDGKDNGVVITSLYARSGNRWYIKQVKEGHGVGLDLSREEESALQKAKPTSEDLIK